MSDFKSIRVSVGTHKRMKLLSQTHGLKINQFVDHLLDIYQKKINKYMYNEIIKYEKYLPIKEINNGTDSFELIFIDMKIDDNDNDTISPDVFTKKQELRYTDIENIHAKILKKIIKLSKENIDKFSIIDIVNNYDGITLDRKILSQILLASNFIATDGRIGPANTILISNKNYKIYKKPLKMLDDMYDIILDDGVEDLILYRKNDYDQPGVDLVYNDNKYDVVDIGFFPHKQFINIKLETKIVKKWKYVMESMNIKSEHYELFSKYAEQHSRLENDSSMISIEKQTLLPLSLKVLKRLLEKDMKDKNFIELSDKPLSSISIVIDIDKKDTTIEYIQELENKLIDKFIDYLVKKDKIIIYYLVQNIKIEKNEAQNKMILISNIK